jgi:hypothetical protein
VVDDLIDHLYTGGANDRHFSESIAAATEASTRVTRDTGPGLRHLDTMPHLFNLWDDHLEVFRIPLHGSTFCHPRSLVDLSDCAQLSLLLRAS